MRLLIMLLWGWSVWAQTFALSGYAKATGVSSASTTEQDITGAKLLIAIIASYSGDACAATVSSTNNAAVTWTSVQNYAGGGSSICVFHKVDPVTSASEVLTVVHAGSYPTIFASWWTLSSAGAITKDQHNGAYGTADPSSTGSVTPGTDNQLIITGLSDNSGASVTVSPAAFTLRDEQRNASTETGAWAYEIQTTATSRDASWGGHGGPKSMTIVTFKATSAPAPSTVQRHRGFVQ